MNIEDLKAILFKETGISLESFMDKTPEEIVKLFEEKGLALTDSWIDSIKLIHDRVFTVAKIGKIELLQDIYDSVLSALENGEDVREFRKKFNLLLMKKGWLSGELSADEEKIITSPWRLNLIYRQNIQSSYMAGRLIQQKGNSSRPYWQYIGVLDRNTRLTHEMMQKYFADKVLHFSNKFWETWYPPCGYQCRCRVRSYSLNEVRKLDLTIIKVLPTYIRKLSPDEGFDKKPTELISIKKEKYSDIFAPIIEGEK